MTEKTKIFIAEHCEPCQGIKKLAAEGQLGDNVEVIDVESEDGFPYIEQFGLERVPVAVKPDGKFCAIEVDVEAKTVTLICDENPQPSPVTE